MRNNIEFVSKNTAKWKNRFIPLIVKTVICVIVVSVLSFCAFQFFKLPLRNISLINAVHRYWAKYDYEHVYEACSEILSTDPFNNVALTLKGYSGFYLAVAQPDSAIARDYLDTAIINMRVAKQNAKSSLLPQLNYMLGKAYFYKNTLSSYYYYADLVILYLKEAQRMGYRSNDISEYLGLSYAALDMTMESIAAFTEALLYRETDMLLMAIAEQYYKAGQQDAAKQYLYRITVNTDDENLRNRGHLLLGKIYIDTEQYEDAMQEFSTILKNNQNSADAHYYIGVIYENQGDLIKARSEWRNALKLQVNHQGALSKMSEYK
ncbi:MAG: tetratricopeptide repeat protein [Treponema sp.]|nr:tetratricopeptide repeat protein [Treponema sp.]